MPLNPDDSPGFLLWHVTLRWQRDIAAALAPLGLTHVQFVLLATAWWMNSQGDDPNQLGLARQAGTDVKMTSQVLRKLEAKGLIRRQVDPADTRARTLHVTERGADLAVQAVTAVEAADAGFFQAIPDTTALQAMLRQLAGRDVRRPELRPLRRPVGLGPRLVSSWDYGLLRAVAGAVRGEGQSADGGRVQHLLEGLSRQGRG